MEVIGHLKALKQLAQNVPSTWNYHCVKSVRIQSYSGPYFPTFGLNTPVIMSVTLNTDTFYAVCVLNERYIWNL